MIYDNFSKAQEQEDILKQAAKEEKEKMKSQNLQKTPSRPSKKSNNALVKWSYDIIMTPSFNLFILLIIILNTVILAMDKYPMDDKLENILDWINVVLTFIFGIEMVIKLIGLGIMDYANDRFNLFDAAIVVFSIIELALVPPGSNRDAGGISALRGFRLLRVFKLAK